MARALLAVCLGVCLAQIRVLAPNSLVERLPSAGRIIGTTAIFGVPYYGERLVGQLKYARSRNPAQGPHCTADDYELGPVYDGPAGQNEVAPLLNIVIVQRGICTFVTKVRVAQESKGAHAVIIVDSDTSDYTSETINNLIVADDGYGSTVKIPSIMVAKDEGKKLIEAVERGDNVIVELAWDIPVNKIVILDMWMSAAAEELRQFVKEFEPIRESLGWNLAFFPHYHVISLPSDFNSQCWAPDGAYCTEDPDVSGPVTGRDVLEESVRQLCILDHTKAPDPSGQSEALYSVLYWKYLTKFQADCPVKRDAGSQQSDNPAHRFGKVCAEQVMSAVLTRNQIDAVQRCIPDTATTKLAEHRGNRAWSARAVRINGWRYSGPIDADAITRAICSGYVDEPPACSMLRLKYSSPGAAPGTISFATFIFIVGLIVLGAFGMLACYRRVMAEYVRSSIREEVMLEVKHQMTDYAPLRD